MGAYVGGNESSIVLEVATVNVSGTVTLNEQLPQVTAACANNYPYQAATVSFRETTHGYSFLAGIDCTDTGFTWSTVVYPGTYEVTVSGNGTSSTLPAINYIALDALALGSDVAGIVLDVQTLNVSGSVTLNEQTPQVTAACASNYPYQAATVAFRETTHGYSFSATIGCTDPGFTWSKVVFPGTYEVTVGGNGTSSNLPATNYIAASALALTATTSGVTLDIVTVEVGGQILLNGQPPQVMAACASSYPYQAATVSLLETTHGYGFESTVGCTDPQFTWSALVFPGTYQVTVSGNGTSSNLPATNYVAVDALQLQ